MRIPIIWGREFITYLISLEIISESFLLKLLNKVTIVKIKKSFFIIYFSKFEKYGYFNFHTIPICRYFFVIQFCFFSISRITQNTHLFRLNHIHTTKIISICDFTITRIKFKLNTAAVLCSAQLQCCNNVLVFTPIQGNTLK
jgi:hypothetical protein